MQKNREWEIDDNMSSAIQIGFPINSNGIYNLILDFQNIIKTFFKNLTQ